MDKFEAAWFVSGSIVGFLIQTLIVAYLLNRSIKRNDKR